MNYFNGLDYNIAKVEKLVVEMVNAQIEDRLNMLRQKLAVAREAKGYGQDDLYNYLISSAEELVAELEELIK